MYLWFRWVGQSTTAALLNPMRKPCVNLSLMNLAKVGSGCVAKTGAQVASSGSMPGRGGGNSVYGVCLEEALSICTRFWVYLYNACMMCRPVTVTPPCFRAMSMTRRAYIRVCSLVHFTAMNDRKQSAHVSGEDTSLSLGVGAVVTHWVELEPCLCTSSIRWWRTMLSPSSSFMSTYSPLLIFSTMLAGTGGVRVRGAVERDWAWLV